MQDITQIDIAEFNERALELVAPHVTRAQGIVRRPINGRTLIYMGVKTHRTAMHGGDFDAQGSSPPSDSADEAAQQVADEYGLKVKWEECEKGWGTFYWEAKS